jgi:glycosyltransferase involved in cell wall biosynthesis
MKFLIIVPAYNEAAAITDTLASLAPLHEAADVVVVNDGSRDATGARVTACAAAHPWVTQVILPFNAGIGSAMQAGFAYAVRHGYDYAVQFDADGQHQADQVPALVAKAREQQLDLCVGSRFLDLNAATFRSTWARRQGIRFFSRLISLLVREPVTDPTSGFRVYGRRALEVFARTYPDDYPEPEALFWCFRNKLRVAEVPVVMQERQGGQSSIRRLRTLYYMVKVTMAILIDRLRNLEVGDHAEH